VNGRSNQLIGVSALVMFARFVYKDGKRVRQFDVLELERRSVAFFPLTWTVVHPIDENSPVYGMTEADLRASEAEFLVLLTATDETFATVVHQRSSYKSDEIRFGSRFVSVYGANQPGEPISINIKRLSKTEQAGS
jgi:inward rectifier potassium channel